MLSDNDNPCADLNLDLATGPEKSRRRRTMRRRMTRGYLFHVDVYRQEAAQLGYDGAHAPPPGHAQSKREQKASKQVIDANVSKRKFHGEVVEILRNPPPGKASETLASSVEILPEPQVQA